MFQPNSKYRLSDEPGDFGLQCSGEGLTSLPISMECAAMMMPAKRWMFVIPFACCVAACSADAPKEIAVEPKITKITTMTLYEATKTELVSSDIALGLAELMFRKIYGEAVLANQMPLKVLDRGQAWQVEGTFRKYSSPDLDDPEGGQIVIVIKKTNCQILEFARLLIPPQSGAPPPSNSPPSPPPAG